MAFVQPFAVSGQRAKVVLSTCHIKFHVLPDPTNRPGRPQRAKSPIREPRLEHEAATTDTNTISATASPIPSSFETACEEARSAVLAALCTGQRRLFVDLDTTNGDATYTTLKTTTPTALALSQAFEGDGNGDRGDVQIVFPDAGAAALAKRDWEGSNSKFRVVGLEQYEYNADDAAVILVVPRASEVDKLAALVRQAGNVPVIVINPDLVDMGVTGLSLNARRLRTEIIDLFDSVYFLRVFPWGVLYRKYPDKWELWVDDANEECGFRRIASLDERPGTIEIEEILEGEMQTSGNNSQPGGGAFAKAVRGFQRFISAYSKG